MDYDRTFQNVARSGGTTAARIQNDFINRVFGWMTAGLALTGVIAWITAEKFAEVIMAHQGIYMLLIVAELLLVFGLSLAFNKISAAGAALGFIVFAILNGLTLSTIFLVYSQSTIASAFFSAAGAFGAAGLFGYLTRRNLSTFGTACLIGVCGLLIAMIFNMIWPNGTAGLIISWGGVILFSGLTAWDLQKLKKLAFAISEGAIDEQTGRKTAVFGALTLYLDFINIFLFLLRIFGGGRK